MAPLPATDRAASRNAALRLERRSSTSSTLPIFAVSVLNVVEEAEGSDCQLSGQSPAASVASEGERKVSLESEADDFDSTANSVDNYHNVLTQLAKSDICSKGNAPDRLSEVSRPASTASSGRPGTSSHAGSKAKTLMGI